MENKRKLIDKWTNKQKRQLESAIEKVKKGGRVCDVTECEECVFSGSNSKVGKGCATKGNIKGFYFSDKSNKENIEFLEKIIIDLGKTDEEIQEDKRMENKNKRDLIKKWTNRQKEEMEKLLKDFKEGYNHCMGINCDYCIFSLYNSKELVKCGNKGNLKEDYFSDDSEENVKFLENIIKELGKTDEEIELEKKLEKIKFKAGDIVKSVNKNYLVQVIEVFEDNFKGKVLTVNDTHKIGTIVDCFGYDFFELHNGVNVEKYDLNLLLLEIKPLIKRAEDFYKSYCSQRIMAYNDVLEQIYIIDTKYKQVIAYFNLKEYAGIKEFVNEFKADLDTQIECLASDWNCDKNKMVDMLDWRKTLVNKMIELNLKNF